MPAQPMNEISIKISKELKKIAENLDEDIQKVAGERMGFTLMIFTEGRTQYISNVDRETSVDQILKMLEAWANDMPDVPAHEVS